MTDATYLGSSTSNIKLIQLSYTLDHAFVLGVDGPPSTDLNDLSLDQNGSTYELKLSGDGASSYGLGVSAARVTNFSTYYWQKEEAYIGAEFYGISGSDTAAVSIQRVGGATAFATNNNEYKFTLLFAKYNTSSESGAVIIKVMNASGVSQGSDITLDFGTNQGLYQFEIPAANMTASSIIIQADMQTTAVAYAGFIKSNGSITADSLPCFMKNTEILTPNGIKNIQDIENGDKVITSDGTETTVLFSGVSTTFKQNKNTIPYIIKKDTFSKNVPSKDTYATHYHKIYTEKYGLMTIKDLSLHYPDNIYQTNLEPPYTYYTLVTENDKEYIANNMTVESLPRYNKKIKHFVSSHNINLLKNNIYETI